MPGVALTWRASSRAMARVTFFSRLPFGPMAPGSWPPWPASMAITSGRMPGCIGRRGAGIGSSTCGDAGTGSGLPVAMRVGTPVAIVVVATCVCAGAAGTSAAALAMSAIGSVALGSAAATAAADAASPSPGHSSTSRGPSADCSMRGLSTATLPARSNTMRTVPGSGWPLRTAFTTPVAFGRLRPRRRRLAGKSTTRRSGLRRSISLYAPSRSSSSSARVPVAPVSIRNCLISEAFARFQQSAATSRAANTTCSKRIPLTRIAGS